MGNYENTGSALIFQNLFYNEESGTPTTPVETQNYTVIQVADSYYLSDFEIKNHTQFCDLEVTFVTYGNLVCTTGNESKRLHRNDAYISFRGEQHGLSSRSASRFQTLAVNIRDGSVAEPMLSQLRKTHTQPRSKQLSVGKLAPFMTAIIAEFYNQDAPFRAQVIDCSITAVLAELARGEACPAQRKRQLPQSMLPNAIHYIDKHFLEMRTLNEVSEHLGYSHGYLCRSFRQVNGMTMQEYLLQKKMQYAAVRLCEGQQISELAEELGYQSICNFSRAFKKYYGTSPRNWTRQEKITTIQY